MRNPKWIRDEVILALDLYFKLEPGQIHSKNPLIIELSELLNELPLHTEKEERFRNANGVALKLSNFLALDEAYTGKGMSSTSKLDKEVFKEFENNKTLLRTLAEAIKSITTYPEIKEEILLVNEDVDDDYSRIEGNILYRYHLSRERNPTLVKKKKEQALRTHGKLECELCSFNYEKVYGVAGLGFMECHHKKPLYTVVEETKTTLNDLMLVCANCHRMLHRGWDEK